MGWERSLAWVDRLAIPWQSGKKPGGLGTAGFSSKSLSQVNYSGAAKVSEKPSVEKSGNFQLYFHESPFGLNTLWIVRQRAEAEIPKIFLKLDENIPSNPLNSCWVSFALYPSGGHQRNLFNR